jgi:hypothetical protein
MFGEHPRKPTVWNAWSEENQEMEEAESEDRQSCKVSKEREHREKENEQAENFEVSKVNQEKEEVQNEETLSLELPQKMQDEEKVVPIFESSARGALRWRTSRRRLPVDPNGSKHLKNTGTRRPLCWKIKNEADELVRKAFGLQFGKRAARSSVGL